MGFQVCGRKSEIEAERCNNDGIKVFKVAEPTGPFFSYEPPMPNNFGNEPNSGVNTFLFSFILDRLFRYF